MFYCFIWVNRNIKRIITIIYRQKEYGLLTEVIQERKILFKL